MALLSCPADSEETRPFAMGFTPWAWAETTEAVSDTYTFINAEGDLVAHHFQQGLPYTAADPSDYSALDDSIQSEITGRIEATAHGKVLYLALDCLNGKRDDLATLWGSSPNLPLPEPWDTRGFDSPEVIDTYIGFASLLMGEFRTRYGVLPDYFNYAPEISELMIESPERYDDFCQVFAPAVYAALKGEFPDVDFMVSLALKTPGILEMDTVKAGFLHLAPYTDLVGISVYPYAFFSHENRGNPATLPPDWLSQITVLAPGFRYAVTEAGWPAEDVDITASDWSLSVECTEAWQRDYLERLLTGSAGLNAEAVIWFTGRDYDTLWVSSLGSDPVAALWRDTGLRDQVGNEREALTVWRDWFDSTRIRSAHD
jgi:hypothetical protein